MSIEIEFDDRKNAINHAKHGLPLSLAALLFDGVYEEKVDDRRNYGETRMIAMGAIAGRLCVCAYTWRNGIRRIISLGKANRRESDAYNKNKQ